MNFLLISGNGNTGKTTITNKIKELLDYKFSDITEIGEQGKDYIYVDEEEDVIVVINTASDDPESIKKFKKILTGIFKKENRCVVVTAIRAAKKMRIEMNNMLSNFIGDDDFPFEFRLLKTEDANVDFYHEKVFTLAKVILTSEPYNLRIKD